MKAVFFDIDGTLLDNHAVIPQSTKVAIKKLKENGYLSFICSGRTRSFIYEPFQIPSAQHLQQPH